MSGAVLRQVVHVSLGGSRIRVQFSNLGGNGSVVINSAHIALCRANPVDSTIDTTTDKALVFNGSASVTIAQNTETWSDAIDFALAAGANVTITTAFMTVPANVVGHSGSRTTSYLQTGSNNVTAASMTTGVTMFDHWYYISGIDVMADAAAKGIVAIGDSITDGRGTDTNHNNRWTDILAARVLANSATANVSTMNQGIGATNLIGNSGTAAQARFARDVLNQSGVRYAIVFDGVNDIGASNATAAAIQAAYQDLITRAHAKGLLIYGATITPFGGNAYFTTAHEAVRQAVNTFIRSGAFDGFIDFDAAVADPADPTKMLATYSAWSMADGLHPGPAGYQKMGDSVDLTLFTR
jgi:lysophospholipase L1-like esterase